MEVLRPDDIEGAGTDGEGIPLGGIELDVSIRVVFRQLLQRSVGEGIAHTFQPGDQILDISVVFVALQLARLHRQGIYRKEKCVNLFSVHLHPLTRGESIWIHRLQPLQRLLKSGS